MSEDETISWKLESVAFSSESTIIDYNLIKQITDGINHAILTDKEIQFSTD
ncbi:MAG: hypothetical protein K8R67_17420 [Desulfobacteraceae bacterium]|nr:hypothetical protein [Desulfobacteraceae bacterium]